ncbi:GDSL esterase/lipase At5g03610-like [Ziziphus jujuba]|uniref:GDSL esterase/lipase At5g03610-like n=1 Tax=Ziziphus jujuba TaxID=326968 RepID=A0ABM3I7D9_ZIZJJ|nr:GDSL esterase/lipase At5g03610-like [Ziziphus jujuba]
MDKNNHPYTFFLTLLCCSLLLLILSGQQGVEASGHHHHRHHHHHLYSFRPTKLFVFGDSYSDTGNNRKSEASSWKYPYGITFPGKPSGRFSDGRVLTDFLAKFVGVRSPLPYQWRNVAKKYLKYGMNFAHGGTGVFNTLVTDPNMTVQIDLFQQLIKQCVYNLTDLHTSVALVTVAGNDYSAYIVKNGTAQGFPSFITSVVNQLYLNLKRIHSLGVNKIAVTALEPLGCLPRSTAITSFQQCNGTENTLVNLHNALLQQAVAKLNNETKDSAFLILDLYASFMTVFKNKGDGLGNIKFENPMKPCCIGISSEYSCGSVDKSGAKKYTICDDPQSTFFWDAAHPTQQGWTAVYSALQATLDQIFSKTD